MTMRPILCAVLILVCSVELASAGVCYVDRTGQMAKNSFATSD
jgi:hypothetical protein